MNTPLETITDFVVEAFSCDHEYFISVLSDYERYKTTRENAMVGESLFKEYADKYRPLTKVKTICLLRQYEDYLIVQLSLIQRHEAALN